MDNYHDILQLYQSYYSIPAQEQWYILTEHSRPEECKRIKRILFPPQTSKNDIKCRESLLYLYVWDMLFYNKYPYKEEYLWKNSEHKNIIMSSLHDLLESNPPKEINKLFLDICVNWPEIRDAYNSFKETKLSCPDSIPQNSDDVASNNLELELNTTTKTIIDNGNKDIMDYINFPSSIVVEINGLKLKFGPSKSGWGVDFTNKSHISDWIIKRTVFPILHKVQENSKYTFSVTLYSLSKDNIEYNINQAFSIACNKIESKETNKEKVIENYSSKPKQKAITYIPEIVDAVVKNAIFLAEQNIRNVTNAFKWKLWNIGDFYDTEDKKGIVFWVNDIGTHGKIVSLDQAYVQWCTPKAQKTWKSIKGSSKEDGIKNTHQVLDGVLKDQYPAFLWCKTHGPDWYFPSLNEMEEVLHNDCVINALKKHGIHTPSLKNHWTSTEINSRYAYMISKTNGQEKSAKELSALVRAVCEF